jgi:hypothetical protein
MDSVEDPGTLIVKCDICGEDVTKKADIHLNLEAGPSWQQVIEAWFDGPDSTDSDNKDVADFCDNCWKAKVLPLMVWQTRARELEALIQEKRAELLGLTEGWDGEHAKPIAGATLDWVFKTIRNLFAKCREGNNHWALPLIFPGSDGEIELQWELDTIDLIVIMPASEAGKISYVVTGTSPNGETKQKGETSPEGLYELFMI